MTVYFVGHSQSGLLLLQITNPFVGTKSIDVFEATTFCMPQTIFVESDWNNSQAIRERELVDVIFPSVPPQGVDTYKNKYEVSPSVLKRSWRDP